MRLMLIRLILLRLILALVLVLALVLALLLGGQRALWDPQLRRPAPSGGAACRCLQAEKLFGPLAICYTEVEVLSSELEPGLVHLKT